jgi:hypothetical protein
LPPEISNNAGSPLSGKGREERVLEINQPKHRIIGRSRFDCAQITGASQSRHSLGRLRVLHSKEDGAAIGHEPSRGGGLFLRQSAGY